MPEQIEIRARTAARTCPMCHDAVAADAAAAAVACAACGVRYHPECANRLDGACGTLGCTGALPLTYPDWVQQGPPRFHVAYAVVCGALAAGLMAWHCDRHHVTGAPWWALTAGLGLFAAYRAGWDGPKIWARLKRNDSGYFRYF